MITNTDFKDGINEFLKPHGFSVFTDNEGVKGKPEGNDADIQTLVDGYDPLPYEKAQAQERILLEASKRAAAIYTFIDPTRDQAIGLYQFASDLYTSIVPTSREVLSGRLLQFKDVHDKAQAAIAQVNLMTDFLLVRAYDAVNDPGW